MVGSTGQMRMCEVSDWDATKCIRNIRQRNAPPTRDVECQNRVKLAGECLYNVECVNFTPPAEVDGPPKSSAAWLTNVIAKTLWHKELLFSSL